MPKRHRRRPEPPSLSAKSTTPARRDPITRLSRFNEILALGLVAASFFLNFANDLSRPNAPPVPLDHFPDLLQKSAIIAVTFWVNIWISLSITV